MTAMMSSGDDRPSDARVQDDAPRVRSAVESLRGHIANISHELKTPTTVISGLATTLLERRAELTPEQVDEVLRRLSRQSDRLARLLSDLLDLAALEAGQLDVRLETVRIADVVSAGVTAAAPPPEVSVSVEVQGDPRAVADPDRLEQVLVNLLTNAFRYGGRAVSIQARYDPGGVLVQVTDDGPGVEPDRVSRLFEPFSRGTRGGQGSGLGLWIARGFVETMGGRIWYERGQPGAHFSIMLLAGGGESKPPASAPQPEPADTGTSSFRVLVVDDEPDTVFLYEMILRRAGHEVISASNGEEALTRLAEAEVDIVITDLMMPIMDGKELIDRLRADSRTAGIPVALVSASSTAGMRADAMVRKPFRAEQILDVVGRLARRH